MHRRAHTRACTLTATSVAAGLVLASVPAVAASAADADAASVPKNVILMISDGAGYNQFDAASLYEHGTSAHQVAVDPATGAIAHEAATPGQVYETWPVQVAQSHYSASGRAEYVTEKAWGDFGWVASGATDSAAAGTALGTGVKTNNGTLGFAPGGDRLLTVGEQAQEVGKKVGLVTSVPFNHATPAGFIAHNADRNDYQGLAAEMIDSGVDVLMGGGHPMYTDAHEPRPADWTWIAQRDYERVSTGATPFTFIEDKADFDALAAGTAVPDKVFGLAQVAETLQYNRPGLANDTALPYTDPANDVADLDTLARGALNVLDTGDEGFFLMVEGGAVDWAGHANQTTRLVEEQIAFNDAVEAVESWVEENSSWDETLVIVTADHETGYLAGAGAGAETGWTPMTGAAGQLPDLTWHSGGHTNALVPLFAKGAGADVLEARADQWDLVRGAYLDNTAIGETIFDVLGHGERSSADAVALEATIAGQPADGALSLSVAGHGERVSFGGSGADLDATLPLVTVADTRNEVRAQGRGWTLAGTATDFVAGNRTLSAENLAWAPRIVRSEAGAAAGGRATLAAPATLATADRTSRLGSTVIGADLDLTVPADAAGGRYGSEITLTLFAQD
ncbi:alkaline phosphatase [Microbacterium sp. SGAir0570]|jgi:alkaline phosphatase|uniref:alkaline phosphatase n=1 Tax=unclassified Microbacterium TaxID=2609290 RepID=UPI000CDD3148|nr:MULTISPECIES: alkaline phosphatase [unclassified Microbacterium]POX65601.1 alkaline phosphatase [Microbacterium sp. Ru50]QCR41209.1 alkaline phosphatase [Microbacterium sp. SGAir0570]